MATGRVYLFSALIAGVVAAATSFGVVRWAAPAPAAGTGSASEPRTVVLDGVAELGCASRDKPSEVEVFYKAPFASPPQLTFPDGLDNDFRVADQKAGSFRLQRVSTSGLTYAKLKWQAEGLPAR